MNLIKKYQENPNFSYNDKVNEVANVSSDSEKPVKQSSIIFNPHNINYNGLKQSFTGENYFAFIDDSRVKSGMQSFVRNEDREKWALAAYFSFGTKEDIRYCYGNLDSFIKHYNGGELQSVESAYKDIAGILNPEIKPQGGWAEVAKAGGAKVMQPISNILIELLEGVANSRTYTTGDIGGYKAIKKQTDSHAKVADQLRDEIPRYYKEVAEKNAEAALDEDWIKHWNDGRWLLNATKAIGIEAPSLAVQYLIGSYLGPLAFAGTMGGSAGLDKYYNLKWDNPEMDESSRLGDSMVTGVIASGSAWLTAGLIKNKIPLLNRDIVKNSFVSGLTRFAGSVGAEASQEAVEQLAENTTDLAFGVYGDKDELTDQEYKDLLWGGVAESAFIGGVFGGTVNVINSRSLKELDQMRATARQAVNQRQLELRGKEELSAQEQAELKELNILADAGNADKMIPYAIELANKQQAVLEQEANAEFDQQLADSDLTIEELQQRNASEALARVRTRQALPHSVQESAAKVTEFTQSFRNMQVNSINSWESAPPEIKKYAESQGYNQPRAFTYQGEVWLNLERVRPSEVATTLTHEVVGHMGLQKVLPNGYFDSVMDSIYRDNFASREFKDIARRYLPNSVFEVEDGDTGELTSDVSVDSESDQRLVAEEFVAHIAESKGVKPNWWKEFVQKIRMGLAKRFGKEFNMDDKQIEILIARSARAMRRGRKSQANSKVKFALDNSNREFNKNLEKQVNGELPNDFVYQIGYPSEIMKAVGVPDLPIQLRAQRIIEKSEQYNHVFDINLLKDLPNALYDPIAIFKYGDEKKTQNAIVALNQGNNFFLVGLHFNYNNSGVNSIRGLFPKKTGDWLRWIEQGKALYIDKEKVQTVIRQQQNNLADVTNYSSDNISNIVDEFSNVKPESEKNLKKVDGEGDLSGDDVRFALSQSEFSPAEEMDYIDILRPFVGNSLDKTDSEYMAYLKEKGIEVQERDAHYLAVEAMRSNMQQARERGNMRRDSWLYENVDIWRNVVDEVQGIDFKLKPSFRYYGEEFTGSFISPDVVKSSVKKGSKLKGEAKRKYETKRADKLKNADGMPTDELAKIIARKQGRDPLEVEDEIIEFFRNLKKPDLYKMYHDWKKDNVLNDKRIEKELQEEWLQQEQFRIEDEVVELLSKGQPISSEWIGENRKVYQELYRQLFNGKDAPSKPSQKDIEAINASLTQNSSDSATYAKAYKQARAESYKVYAEKLRELKESLQVDKKEFLALQREALNFGREHLPADKRNGFARSIVSLLEYSNSPSARYPEGKRMSEFNKIIERMTTASQEARRDSGIGEIKAMLDAAKIKRNYKGIPTSVLPAEQAKVDRIRQITNMDIPTLANLLEYNNQQMMKLEDSEDSTLAIERILEDNAIIETFGNLEVRSADDVEVALNSLKEIIQGGKSKFKDKLLQRKANLERMRQRAVDDATFGKNSFKSGENVKNHSEYWLRNMHLGTLLRLVAGKSIQNFEESVSGELYQDVSKALQSLATDNRNFKDDFDNKLAEITHTEDKNTLTKMRQKGAFLKMMATVEEKSGVFKKEYTRVAGKGKGESDFIFEEGRRALVKKSIPIEDYQYYGKTKKGARSLLKDYDNSALQDSIWNGMELDDCCFAFLRQQLADYDAGLKQAYEIFNEESDDANFNRMVEEERSAGYLVVFTHDPNEQVVTQEVPLSQGSALQIVLTWEQKHYQPNMKWNGWSEDSIKQLKAFIKPEVLEFGYWMRDYIAQNKSALDDKVYDIYGARLPVNENYYPAAFGGNARNIQSDNGMGSRIMSINPNFLIARKFHTKPLDTEVSAISVFLGGQLEQRHFLAMSDVVRDLKGVYGNSMVQKAIRSNFGDVVVRNLTDGISTLARGGGKINGEYFSVLLNKMFRHVLVSKILLNPSSLIKQKLGQFSYMNNMPIKDFVKYYSVANLLNPEFRDFLNYARKTDYAKNRFAGGAERDLQFLLNSGSNPMDYSPTVDLLMQIGSAPTLLGDAYAIYPGGFAIYKYNKKMAMNRGATATEAHDIGMKAWMQSTDETQQSGALKDLNYFQTNHGAYRYFTAFLSNSIQLMNLEYQTLKEIQYGNNKKAGYKKLGRQIFVNHIIIPTLMQFTSDMIRLGFDLSEWADEVEFEDYFLAWLLGPMEGAFLFGKVGAYLGDKAFDLALGRPASWNSGISAVPLADDLSRDIGTIRQLTTDDITPEEIMGGIKALGDVGMAMGTLSQPVGALGAIVSAIGTQGRRVMSWFSDDGK